MKDRPDWAAEFHGEFLDWWESHVSNPYDEDEWAGAMAWAYDGWIAGRESKPRVTKVLRFPNIATVECENADD